MLRAARSADPAGPGPIRSPYSATVTYGVAGAGAAAIGVALLLSPDHIEDGPVVCPFRRLTGLPCPGCGLTRSWTYLVHGRLDDSFAAHAFGPLLLVAVLALIGFVLVAALRRRPPPDLDEIVRHPVAIVLIGAWLTFSVFRLGFSV